MTKLIASKSNMTKAFDWLCRARSSYGASDSVWAVLFKKKSTLRAYVKKMYDVLHRLKLTLAKNKTYIGKVSKGFSFLGYFLKAEQRVQLSKKTLEKCVSRIAQYYVQVVQKKHIEQYVKHFVAWANKAVEF